ncbi:MAG: copper amine oxidase N-terminal domain-containing protein [Oscillospiraceae bacterium]
MKKQLKDFLRGFLAALLVIVLMIPAYAAIQKKTATLYYNDIKITLNGKTLIPKDANGNIVEPFIIDGTTYLPVRAISSALGLGVEWDQNTNTVKLTNKAPSSPAGTVVYDKGGIKITYLGFEKFESEYGDEEYVEYVKLFIENSTPNRYQIFASYASINDIMTEDVWLGCEITGGKSAYTDLVIPDYALDYINVSSIKSVEFCLLFYDVETYEDFETGAITIKK